jgi:hypothetical protein
MTDHTPTDPLDAFAAELIQSGAHLALILEHMSRSAAAGGATGAEPIDVVLRRLFRNILEDHLPPAFTVEEVGVATRVLRLALDGIGRDLLLVDTGALTEPGGDDGPGAPPPRGRPRRRRP